MNSFHIESAGNDKAVLMYFFHQNCSVCKVFKPKVEALVKEQFPLIKIFFFDAVEQPEMAAHYSVFSVPSLVVLFEGKEAFRFGRNVGTGQLKEALSRPYKILFG